jgi:hypothetical protein
LKARNQAPVAIWLAGVELTFAPSYALASSLEAIRAQVAPHEVTAKATIHVESSLVQVAATNAALIHIEGVSRFSSVNL